MSSGPPFRDVTRGGSYGLLGFPTPPPLEQPPPPPPLGFGLNPYIPNLMQYIMYDTPLHQLCERINASVMLVLMLLAPQNCNITRPMTTNPN
jgi:hypothetical protein